jgi:hypothetical protein
MEIEKTCGIDVPPHFLTLPPPPPDSLIFSAAASAAVSPLSFFLRRLIHRRVLNFECRPVPALADLSIWIRRRSCDYRGIYVDQENERKGETTGGISKRS